MKILIIISILCSACGIKWSQRYDIAITDISYHHHVDDLQMIGPFEIKQHQFLINQKDTIWLVSNRKNFGIRDKKTKEMFFFQFGWDDSYTTIQCDSLWNVVLVSVDLGPVY